MSNDYFAKKISLREEEDIIIVLHHHLITYAKQIAITVVLILLAFFLMFYLFSLGAFGVALFLALLFIGLFYGAREFYVWYMNVFIITNQRIIDIDQTGFFNKTVSEASYDKVLDICYSVHGLGQTVLKLGTIKINAAGVKLVIKNVSNVIKVNQLLADLIKQQTGKKIEPKKIKELNSKEKEQVTEDFLNQEEFDEYDDYDLNELIEEYKDIFGELSLKKLLVDELEKYDEELDNEEEDEPEIDEEEQEEEVIEEPAGNFTKKKL